MAALRVDQRLARLVRAAARRLPRHALLGLVAAWWPVAAQMQELIVNASLTPPALSQNEARLF
ncbi:MAG TPA: hypothetical protein VES73_13580, partial [Lamprocystis sp. (in: g-proteobacteria)]|nr:hypothetical protein [Lamprocystis sp. (in: g-proteobacteria)]